MKAYISNKAGSFCLQRTRTTDPRFYCDLSEAKLKTLVKITVVCIIISRSFPSWLIAEAVVICSMGDRLRNKIIQHLWR